MSGSHTEVNLEDPAAVERTGWPATPLTLLGVLDSDLES